MEEPTTFLALCLQGFLCCESCQLPCSSAAPGDVSWDDLYLPLAATALHGTDINLAGGEPSHDPPAGVRGPALGAPPASLPMGRLLRNSVRGLHRASSLQDLGKATCKPFTDVFYTFLLKTQEITGCWISGLGTVRCLQGAQKCWQCCTNP